MTQSVQTKSDILRAVRDSREQLRALGVSRVGLFGSFARGEQRAASDIDLLVEFEPGQKNFDHFMQVCYLLEEALQRRVELLTPESLSPYLGPKILEEVEYVPISA